jgi:hypothetical protein
MTEETCSEYYLERYFLGELPEEDIQEIRQRATVDPEVLAALENIESSNRAILLRYPPSAVKEKLLGSMAEAQAGKNAKRWLIGTTPLRRILLVSSAFAAALILFVLVRPSRINEGVSMEPREGEEYSQAKGTEGLDLSKTQLLVYRKNNDRVEMLADGSLSKAGDLLQLAYVAARAPYGMILSIDGGGGVTLHYPSEEGQATSLTQNKRVLLQNAIELDNAPGFERFFFLTSDSPIDPADIMEKAKSLAADPENARVAKLKLPKGIDQSSLTILKGEGI